MLWTTPLEPDYFRCESFPVFNMEAPEGRFYGFPAYGGPGSRSASTTIGANASMIPTRWIARCHAADEEVLRDGIRRYFPDADGPTLAMQPCLFTNSPDEHFILDVLPDNPDVAVAAGFSGHGFKFCSVVGEIMADLVIDGRTQSRCKSFPARPIRLRDESQRVANGRASRERLASIRPVTLHERRHIE